MPPPIAPLLTPSLLRSLRNTPNLAPHTWYCAAGVALSALNRPQDIPAVLQFELDGKLGDVDSSVRSAAPSTASEQPRLADMSSAASSTERADSKQVSSSSSSNGSSANFSSTQTASAVQEQLRIARRMREALIKSAVINGLPKAINALLALKAATPEHLLDPPLSFSPTARPVDVYDKPSSSVLHRGQRFFDKIYGKVSKRVMGQMDRSGTEDLGLTARLMYGYILSNTCVLNEAESSLVLVAGLIPQDVNPQLKGHLKGALNNGATVEQVRAIRELTMRICEAAGMKRLSESDMNGWGWHTDVANL